MKAALILSLVLASALGAPEARLLQLLNQILADVMSQVLLLRVCPGDARPGDDGQDGSPPDPCKNGSASLNLLNYGGLHPNYLFKQTNKVTNKLTINLRNCILQDYIRDNYCPTLDHHQNDCEEKLSKYYVGMLVIHHFPK